MNTAKLGMAAAALLLISFAHSAPLPKAPRQEVIEIGCVGHLHRSNEKISWSAMIGSGRNPGAFWAIIDKQYYLLTETSDAFIIAGRYDDNPAPNKRYVIDAATGQYAAYRLDGDKSIPLHASRPEDDGCSVGLWRD